ncbi:hypothetical protein [Methylorubrum populi]|uniref:Uncharacterized protein n=1 Tax=Methylorubrum populi TaxID=223967 RepID=A0A833J8E2_9HYPH|nr:hypothetical protein [Methylorubrum populi]KAB7785376.1 hypothetical protein F8B43_1877 [Methylorubrum populi]
MSGLDFEGIATAQVYGREILHARETAWCWQARADRLERELARSRAELQAHQAGLLARIRSLRGALEAVAPFDPVLRWTGRLYDDGHPERVWDASYWDAYDDEARRHGLPPARRPMTPGERERDREAQVLAEPITSRRCLWWRRWWWRGQEHRTRAGAERARERAARDA